MKPIFHATPLPVLQNRVFNSRESAMRSETGELRIVQDPETGLIYNDAFDETLISYDHNYNNEQSISAAFQSHLREVSALISRYLGTRHLLEVGCGKGFFLEMLSEAGFEIYGCDPTYEGSSPRILKQFYSENLGIRDKNIVLRHVLEHIQDPVSFLQEISHANHGGLAYIEVPCLDWIASRGAWFDLFYEHVNYFRLSDLHAMFGTVLQSGRLFGGQYLYVIADLRSVRTPHRVAHDHFCLPKGFEPRLDHLQQCSPISIWGAASKGVIYAIYASRQSVEVQFAIDVNPAKQGKYLPLTGLKVISPQEAICEIPDGAHVVIMNSNYSEEIRRLSGTKFTFLMAENGK